MTDTFDVAMDEMFNPGEGDTYIDRSGDKVELWIITNLQRAALGRNVMDSDFAITLQEGVYTYIDRFIFMEGFVRNTPSVGFARDSNDNRWYFVTNADAVNLWGSEYLYYPFFGEVSFSDPDFRRLFIQAAYGGATLHFTVSDNTGNRVTVTLRRNADGKFVFTAPIAFLVQCKRMFESPIYMRDHSEVFGDLVLQIEEVVLLAIAYPFGTL